MIQALRDERRLLLLWTAAVFVVVGTLDALRVSFWSYGADTGTFAQIILDAFGTMHDGIEHGTHYQYHWSPVLTLLWPLLAATHSMLALQLIQVACTVAVAPLTYMLVEPRAGARVALRVAIVTLVYPPLLAMGWGEFHELGLFAPLALALIVAADRRAWAWFAVVAASIAGVREDVSIEVALAATVLAIAGWRSRIAWTGAAALACASLIFYYGLIVPRAGSWQPAHFYIYAFAAGPLALVLAPLVHPREFLSTFFTFGRLTYLLEAFVPLALLPLRSRWSLLALPGFTIVLLANDGLVYHMGNHYAALWSPWILIGFAFAAARIRSERWIDAAIALCLLVLVFFNPLHPAHFLKPNYHDLAAARATLACVPANASVSTHDEWFSHIAARNPNATLGTIDTTAYLVFADDFPSEEFARSRFPLLRAEVRAGRYREFCRHAGVAAYRRT
ncbi:MAG: hypothetical protein NVSMB5_11390 [Candidatus Velthaea sp.]